MDNKVLDEAVETYLQVECQAINGDDTEYLRCSDRDREIVRAALLASLPVLLGEPVAWRARGMSDAWVYADKPVQHFINTPWEPLYAPSLGEGDVD